jgi:hypothetical protein
MNSIEGLIYAGRTQLQGNRRSSNHKSSYTLRGSYIPSYNTLHVALECTLLESMGAEYLLLLLKGFFNKSYACHVCF